MFPNSQRVNRGNHKTEEVVCRLSTCTSVTRLCLWVLHDKAQS
jgi:hypothetical protein